MKKLIVILSIRDSLRCWTICTLLLGFSMPLVAQKYKLDSLRQALKGEGEDTNKVNTLILLSDKLWRDSNFDTAVVYANTALSLAEKLSNKKGIAKANNVIGIICMYRGDYPQALTHYFKALKIAQELGDKRSIAKTANNLGLVYMNRGDYPKALEYYFTALKTNKSIGDKGGIARNTTNIANVYSDQGDYSQALEYFSEALKLEEEIGDKGGIAQNMGNVGNVYGRKKDYPKALDYFLRVLKAEEEIGDKRIIALFNGNIGIVYINQHDYPKALEYFQKALKTHKEIGNKSEMAKDIGNIGSVFIKQKNYKQAKAELDSSLLISRQLGDKENMKIVYLNLCAVDSATGNYTRAFEDYKKFVSYKDSLINEANTKKTVQTQMNYEFDQKQTAEKAEQEKKDAIADADKRKQLIITWSVVLGLILVLVFAVYVLKTLRITRSQKQDIEKQKEIVEEHRKEIIDSITYAKRLQQAILPPLEAIKKVFPESFLLYKPKDIVAGDFYWMEQFDGTAYIAAADCTGHGVPGAMVSIVCSNALNRAVKEFNLRETGQILDKTRDLVLETFAKSNSEVKDGMDISLLAVNRSQNKVYWSGANNQLWYIENGEMKEITACKQPIGKTDNPKPFITHTLELKAGRIFYLMTDGYPDQFGGPKGKKYKYKPLQEMLVSSRDKHPEEQREILLAEFDQWKGGLEQVDDVTIIGLRL